MFSRDTIRFEYGNSFDLVVNYGDSDFAWRVELATVFGIITYDNGSLSSGLVDSNDMVNIADVQNKLLELNINIIQIASLMLEEGSSISYSYETSRIVRLNLITPLEQMSNCINVTYEGIDISDLPFTPDPDAYPPFEWINDGSHKTDLEELYELFVLLGATNLTEAEAQLDSVDIFDPRYTQIVSIAENSYFLSVVVYNQILNP